MTLISVTEFRANMSKYLQRAFTEQIALKSKGGIIELTPSKTLRFGSSLSPSGDPWYDNPRNEAMVIEAIEEHRRTGGKNAVRLTEEEHKALFS